MNRLLGVALLVFALSGTSWADEPDQPAAPETVETASATKEVSREPLGKTFWVVGAALNGAMIADTKSTFDVVRVCLRCVEANPYVAPFIKKGPAVAYTAGELFDIGVMAIAARMKNAEHPTLRKTWWVVPVAITAGHLIAYRHNVEVAREASTVPPWRIR